MAETEKKKGAGAIVGSVFGALALMAASAVGGWIACGMWPKIAASIWPGANAAAMSAAMQQPAVTVAVTNVESRVYNLPERYVAHAEAVQEVDLLPQIDGYVKEVKFKEGDTVKAGDILYEIDAERYQAVVNQRKADLEAAEAEARRAERYWERMQKADSRGITQLERDNAEAGAEKSKAAVLQAKANLVVAEYDLKKTKVVAPISGQIGKTAAHVGDYVSPSKGALAHIVQIDPIRVTFPFTDREYVAWREAQKRGEVADYRMRLLLPDGSTYDKTGTWEFDDNQMSRETATIIMRLSFPNPDRLLVPNSYVTLLTDHVKPPSFPAVPQQCVFDLAAGSQAVWILRDDMTVEQRPVKTREAFNGFTPVVSGLKVGEKIVLSGTGKLGPGMKVSLATPTANADIDANFQPPIKE